MIRRHTISTRTDTRFPYTTLFRSTVAELRAAGIALDAPLGQYQSVVRNGKRIPLGGGTESLGIWNKTEPVWDAAAGAYTEVSTRSEEHTSELQSLMRISYAVFCLTKKKNKLTSLLKHATIKR